MDDVTDGAGVDAAGAPDGVPVAAVGSLAAAAQAEREQIVRSGPRRLLLDVPGYNGRLVLRFAYPETGRGPITRAIRLAQGGGKGAKGDADLDGSSDLLIAACEAVVGRLPGDKQLRSIRDSSPVDALGEIENPVRLSRTLGDLLAIEVPTEVKSPARFIVRSVFSPRAHKTGEWDGDLALMSMSGKVLEFLTELDREADEELAGE